MNGMITTNENYNLEEVLPKIKEYTVSGVVKRLHVKRRVYLMVMDLKLLFWILVQRKILLVH